MSVLLALNPSSLYPRTDVHGIITALETDAHPEFLVPLHPVNPITIMESNSEKLVLTLIPRYVGHRALSEQSGTLRTSFQRLSRLDGERGIRCVYERLGRPSALDVYVYGILGWTPPDSMGVTAHGVTDDEITQRWLSYTRPEMHKPLPCWPSGPARTTGTASGRSTTRPSGR